MGHRGEIETLRGHQVDLPRPRVARTPRRVWPIAAVVGVPAAILSGYVSFARRYVVEGEPAIVLAAFVALPLLLAGSYALAVPPRAPWRASALVALAACSLVFGFAWGALDPGARTPSGWPSGLPRYPGRLVEVERGGATFRTLRTGGKGRAPGTVTYGQALRDADLPSSRVATSCPALGVDCSLYRAGSLEIVECYADATRAVARVRYGAHACPSTGVGVSSLRTP